MRQLDDRAQEDDQESLVLHDGQAIGSTVANGTQEGRSEDGDDLNSNLPKPRLLDEFSDFEQDSYDELDEDIDPVKKKPLDGDSDQEAYVLDEDLLDEDTDPIDNDGIDEDDDGEEDFVEKQAKKRMEELAAEERAVANRLRKVEEQELQRARTVQKQRGIYDLVVDLRIRMEALMGMARTFPSSAQRRDCEAWNSSEDLTKSLAETRSALSSLSAHTDKAFQTCWPSQDEEMDDDLEDDLDHDKEDVKKSVAGKGRDFKEWRNTILDEWGESTRGGVTPKGGFKVIDTSISGQLKASIASGKPLARTRKVRQAMMLLGDIELEEGSYDMHFDDGELYRSLLREIIESGDGADNGYRYAQVAKSGRVKKKRDRSFAKGKRLKYNVHEKLIGFLAPLPMPDPGPVDEIVASLFGRMGTVAEV